MSHTPGPWEVYGPVDMDYWVIHQYPNRYYQRVATAHWNHPENPSAVLSNAALISAAPDLLEALENLVAINEAHNKAVEGVIGRPVEWKDGYLDEARAAIRKARGEE